MLGLLVIIIEELLVGQTVGLIVGQKDDIKVGIVGLVVG